MKLLPNWVMFWFGAELETQVTETVGEHFYTARTACDNCHMFGVTKIPKGTVRPDKLMCPTCGCNYARTY